MRIRYRRPFFGLFSLALCITSLTAFAQDVPTKKVLKHSDYEIWNTASGFKLSPDGRVLAYTLTPPEGDAFIIIKRTDGPEYRIAVAGKVPTSTEASPATPPAFTPSGSVGTAQFSPDSKFLFASLSPTKADIEKAKADKKKPEELPKAVLGIIDVTTGKVTSKIEKVRGFTVVGEAPGTLIYQVETKDSAATKTSDDKKLAEEKKEEPKKAEAKTGEPKVTGEPKTEPKTGEPKTPPSFSRPSVTTNLVVRSLKDNTESTFTNISSYLVTKDEKELILTVATNKPETSGLFTVSLGSKESPKPIKTGTGRFSSQTWDDNQTRLAFFFVEGATPPTSDGKDEVKAPTTPAPAAKAKVFIWDRKKGDAATELLSSSPKGIETGMMILDRGGLSFSKDGLKLSVSVGAIPPEPKIEPKTEPKGETAPQPRPAAGSTTEPPAAGGRGAGRFGPRPTTPGATTPPADPDRIDLDLWHWKDELIQPMQKLRGAGEREKTYRAVYFFDTKVFRQISSDDWDVTVPSYGDWARGTSDKAYRGMQWLSPSPRDYAFINIRTGETKPWLTANVGQVDSPIGNYVLNFDGKDWKSTNIIDGKATNLTAKLGVPFYNEDFDSPAQTPAYGLRGTTKDRKFAVIADRYDLWKVALDGSGATNITQIGRSSKTKFSLVLLGEDDSTQELDLTKPYLLRAEHDGTGDTGFYRLQQGKQPKLLVMSGKRFGSPTKAKHADTIVLTASTFYDYPDYYVTNTEFQELKKITDLQPRKREFNWGKAELVDFKSDDGVPLQGMLIKPENFDPNKKYPMIVYIYERLSDGLHTFRMPSAGTSINTTYYASNGYLVYMPDICYTIGSPGQSAIKCVLPAIQAVVNQGIVKEDAIGIQGHSWGGYQIAYMVTQTNRFKAANAGAPVSDMVSAYGGIRWGTGLPRQFQYEQTQSRIGATLWQAPLKYIENSPIFMADRVKTPLMMLHNDQDDAVPWYQGIEYYLALRRLGKEVYLFNYNGEFHGLRKKSTQRDYTVRMQQFFDHHLKGAPAPEWMVKGVPFADREKEKESIKKMYTPEKPSK